MVKYGSSVHLFLEENDPLPKIGVLVNGVIIKYSILTRSKKILKPYWDNGELNYVGEGIGWITDNLEKAQMTHKYLVNCKLIQVPEKVVLGGFIPDEFME
jgi:hypothetical protein